MKYVSSLENRDFYSLKNSGTFKQNSQHHVKQSADSERERSCLGTENKTFTFDNQKKKSGGWSRVTTNPTARATRSTEKLVYALPLFHNHLIIPFSLSLNKYFFLKKM